MGHGQKVLTTALWALLVVFMLAVVGTGVMATRRDNERPAAHVYDEQQEYLPVLFAAPPFGLINQDEKPVRRDDLRGRVWIAAFIFTQCAGPCPMMSSKMAKLQEAVPDERVMLVSFTVDPLRDTPQVLRQYAQQFGADHDRWILLTGTEQQMMDVARGMYITALPATEASPIIHSEKFLLVDGQGNVRGVYASADADEMLQLAIDAKVLAEEIGRGEGS